MEWNVYYFNFNSQEIKPFNVFDHSSFYDDVKKHLKKYKDKEEFAEKLKTSSMYFFWCKCEYELIIEITEDNRIFLNPWVGCREPEKTRIDVTDNTDFNWKGFAELYIGNQIYRNKAKIDIHDQLDYVWDEFVDLCWNSKRRRKRKETI